MLKQNVNVWVGRRYNWVLPHLVTERQKKGRGGWKECRADTEEVKDNEQMEKGGREEKKHSIDGREIGEKKCGIELSDDWKGRRGLRFFSLSDINPEHLCWFTWKIGFIVG